MMQRDELLSWLRETDETRLEDLWRQADAVREANVGGDVHLRGLVEFSNYCARQCTYCGLRAGTSVPRYRMSEDEILACAHEAVTLGFGTLVMQSGQDAGMDVEWLADVVRRVKRETALAVTHTSSGATQAPIAFYSVSRRPTARFTTAFILRWATRTRIDSRFSVNFGRLVTKLAAES
jgi:biotin synthase-like enzyme